MDGDPPDIDGGNSGGSDHDHLFVKIVPQIVDKHGLACAKTPVDGYQTTGVMTFY